MTVGGLPSATPLSPLSPSRRPRRRVTHVSPLRARVAAGPRVNPSRRLAIRMTGVGAAALSVGWYLGPEDGLIPVLVLAGLGAWLGIRRIREVWARRTVGRRIRRLAGETPVSLGPWRVGGSGYWLRPGIHPTDLPPPAPLAAFPVAAPSVAGAAAAPSFPGPAAPPFIGPVAPLADPPDWPGVGARRAAPAVEPWPPVLAPLPPRTGRPGAPSAAAPSWVAAPSPVVPTTLPGPARSPVIPGWPTGPAPTAQTSPGVPGWPTAPTAPAGPASVVPGWPTSTPTPPAAQPGGGLGPSGWIAPAAPSTSTPPVAWPVPPAAARPAAPRGALWGPEAAAGVAAWPANPVAPGAGARWAPAATGVVPGWPTQAAFLARGSAPQSGWPAASPWVLSAGGFGWRPANAGVGPFAIGDDVELFATEAFVWIAGAGIERYERAGVSLEPVGEDGLALVDGSGPLRRWVTLVPDDDESVAWAIAQLAPAAAADEAAPIDVLTAASEDDGPVAAGEAEPLERPAPEVGTPPEPDRPAHGRWDDPRTLTDDGRR